MKLQLSKTALVKVMQDETVMIMNAGQIYHVDGIAAKFVASLRQTSSVEAVCARLAQELDVSPKRLNADVTKLIRDLRKFELVTAIEVE
jgi:hypothetical protein